MNSINQIQILKADNYYRESIVLLLQSEKLPVEDLSAHLDNFLIAVEGGHVIGVIGLEQYNDCGLLRSMVVSKEHRFQGVASRLVRKIEENAQALGIDCIYLLTETAHAYFERKGYKTISRAQVPEIVQGSSEFSSVCPASAIVMRKAMA